MSQPLPKPGIYGIDTQNRAAHLHDPVFIQGEGRGPAPQNGNLSFQTAGRGTEKGTVTAAPGQFLCGTKSDHGGGIFKGVAAHSIRQARLDTQNLRIRAFAGEKPD